MMSMRAGSDRRPLMLRRAHIRQFTEDDIPQVARIHQLAFLLPASAPLRAYHEYFTQVFLQNPVGESPLPSLVYEEDDGKVAGFVGIVPRRVTVNGRHFQAVVSSQFIVDPSSHAG